MPHYFELTHIRLVASILIPRDERQIDLIMALWMHCDQVGRKNKRGPSQAKEDFALGGCGR